MYELSLQWGRDQMVAEILGVPRPVQPLRWALQWGRDQMVAEISSQPLLLVLYHPLQWGRDQMVAEIFPD